MGRYRNDFFKNVIDNVYIFIIQRVGLKLHFLVFYNKIFFIVNKCFRQELNCLPLKSRIRNRVRINLNLSIKLIRGTHSYSVDLHLKQ